MTATEFYNNIKALCEKGDNTVLLTGNYTPDLPRIGGRFKVKGGVLIVRPMRVQTGRGFVHPFGAEAKINHGRIVVEQWETEET